MFWNVFARKSLVEKILKSRQEEAVLSLLSGKDLFAYFSYAWAPPSFLAASPLAPHTLSHLTVTLKKNKRQLAVYDNSDKGYYKK